MDEYLQSTQYHDSAITALNSRFPSARDQWNAPQYDSKMTFWKSAIVNTSSLGILCKSSRLVFKPSNLKVNFTRNGVFPVCLDTVLQEMISTHEIIPVQQFMAPKHWALALFNQSLKWLLPAQEISIIDTQIEYLIMPNLKVAANIMISEVRSKCNVTTDYIIDRDELLVTCGCSSLDLDIILAHLTSIGECTTSKTFLKFRNATKNTWDMQINQGDIGIASIKRCKQSLESQISQLTLKNAACHKSAVENSMRNKQVALFHLRQKKQVDAVLLKRMQALETIEGILAKIQQQDTDLSTLCAIRDGSTVLADFMRINGKVMSVEGVDGVMDQLSEVLADSSEIEECFKVRVGEINGDESEIENELDLLIKNEKELVADEHVLVGAECVLDTNVEAAIMTLKNLKVSDGEFSKSVIENSADDVPALLNS